LLFGGVWLQARQVAAELKKRKEYAGKLEEIFAAIDSEGNGVLTAARLQTMTPSHGSPSMPYSRWNQRVF